MLHKGPSRHSFTDEAKSERLVEVTVACGDGLALQVGCESVQQPRPTPDDAVSQTSCGHCLECLHSMAARSAFAMCILRPLSHLQLPPAVLLFCFCLRQFRCVAWTGFKLRSFLHEPSAGLMGVQHPTQCTPALALLTQATTPSVE